MWRAFDTVLQRKVTASEAVKLVGESKEARHKAYEEKRFVCPACGMEVVLKQSRTGRWYFSHVIGKNECEYAYWSEKEEWAEEIHDKFKEWLENRLKSMGIQAEAEKVLNFEEYKLIPDIYYEVGKKKIAVEVVVNSPRTKDEIVEKSRKYAEQGIYVWWIFYWKYKRRDGITLLDIAKASLNEQRISKRLFRKGSVYRLIHALHQGRLFLFDDKSPPSRDSFSVVVAHLLWEDSDKSLIGIMPWVINYKKPFRPYLTTKQVPKVTVYPERDEIIGPFRIAYPNETPHQHVAIIGYGFELRGFNLRLMLRLGRGVAHRYYLQMSSKNAPYKWGVIHLYHRKNKWIRAVSHSWGIYKWPTPKEIVSESNFLFKKLITADIPSYLYNLPVLVWNPKIKHGYYPGKSLKQIVKEGFILKLSKKDIEYLDELRKRARSIGL